jgi:hypothetical protein
MGKYQTLIRILDAIRNESRGTRYVKYVPDENDVDAINLARSKAFIHLYLKVNFGILGFEERERWVTDGSYDGGIDAYFFDHDTKSIYFLQSKFRSNEENFESKQIDLTEILAMDVDRISTGETFDDAGNEYNGKIKQLQREISQIEDVARYRYRIIILANLKKVTDTKLRALTSGMGVEVFDFSRSYKELVFPVVSGTYFKASDITIPVDLSSKSAGAKISYTVTTKASDCEITVLFVPSIEIAKVMSKYKNSILQFNPRSYLDFEGQHVNSSIRATIVDTKTNEFALFNNGITIISDETSINERMGKKSQAQLLIKHPQIINGGQTSYTLSRIYEELAKTGDLSVFDGKEVLLKIITLVDNDNAEAKQQLIDEISNATNKQTPVINADRLANDGLHKAIQSIVFDRYGMLYERKRGEFSDGIANGYVDKDSIIERNLFFRLYYASFGRIELATRKRLFQKNDFPGLNIDEPSSFDRLSLAYQLHSRYVKQMKPNVKLKEGYYAKIYAQVYLLYANDISHVSENDFFSFDKVWYEFLQGRPAAHPGYIRRSLDRKTRIEGDFFNFVDYFKGKDFRRDVIDIFGHESQGDKGGEDVNQLPMGLA